MEAKKLGMELDDVLSGVERYWRRLGDGQQLNLVVPEGAVYALIGPNGAGKITAIRTMMNIYDPDEGPAEIAGKDSRRLRGRDFRAIGYVSKNQKMRSGCRGSV